MWKQDVHGEPVYEIVHDEIREARIAAAREKDSLRQDPRHRTASFAMPDATAWYFSQNERSIAPPLEAEVAAR